MFSQDPLEAGSNHTPFGVDDSLESLAREPLIGRRLGVGSRASSRRGLSAKTQACDDHALIGATELCPAKFVSNAAPPAAQAAVLGLAGEVEDPRQDLGDPSVRVDGELKVGFVGERVDASPLTGATIKAGDRLTESAPIGASDALRTARGRRRDDLDLHRGCFVFGARQTASPSQPEASDERDACSGELRRLRRRARQSIGRAR